MRNSRRLLFHNQASDCLEVSWQLPQDLNLKIDMFKQPVCVFGSCAQLFATEAMKHMRRNARVNRALQFPT